MELKQTIVKDIKNNQVILYMKGTKDMPMRFLQFGGRYLIIMGEYKDVNVLKTP